MGLVISSSLDITGNISASVYYGDGQYLTNIITASYALDSEKLKGRDVNEFINTGSVDGEQAITGSLTITQNLTVLGSASIAYITASQTLVDGNTITVFGSGSGLPIAGYIAADTSSEYASSSFLYNLVDEYWTLDKPLSASIWGTASWAETSSVAITASHALTASYVANASSFPYTGSAEITGSLIITGSQEITGSLTITGSLMISGSITGSLFGTASFALSASFISSSDLQSDVILRGVTQSYQSINTDLGLKGKLAQNYLVNNVVLGASAGESLTSDINYNSNTFVGYSSGRNTLGRGNTLIGASSITKIQGNENIALGFALGQDVETGSNNILIGNWVATNTITELENNIVIGSYTQISQSSQGNIIIGNQINANDVSFQTIIGNNDITLTKLHGTISGSIFTGSFDGVFTGSLEGTASYAATASILEPGATASYALTASLLLGSVESASYSYTASYLEEGATASYALTASSLLGSIESASYAATASYVDSSTLTASFIIPGITSSADLLAKQTIYTDLLLLGKLDVRYGRDNIVIGKDAGFFITQSNPPTDSFAHKENIFIGIQAGYNSITGSSNVVLGNKALMMPSNATNNIVLGNEALSSETTQPLRGNIAIGNSAMKNTISGSIMIENNSIAIGNSALFNATNPKSIIAIGQAAGFQGSDGSPLTNNDGAIYIGEQTRPLSGSNGIFEIVIGYQAIGHGPTTTTIGSPNTTTITYIEGMVTASSFSGSFTGSLEGTAYTASLALDSEKLGGKEVTAFITTGSTDAEQGITGSLTITQNLTVLGSSSFVYVTASQVLVDQNTITVYANGLGLPSAGYLVADTSSAYSGSALLYNVVDEIWTLDKPLSASLQGNATSATKVNGYIHTQTTASTLWEVSHSLDTAYPMVMVWVDNDVVQPDRIVKTSNDNLSILFTVNITGSARVI